jgi:hypothetical protein
MKIKETRKEECDEERGNKRHFHLNISSVSKKVTEYSKAI